jgi:hypothetical protein
VYLCNKKGVIVMAEAKEPKVLATIPLGASSYATPVAANGTLFIASQSTLWAVQKGATLQMPTSPSSNAAADGLKR